MDYLRRTPDVGRSGEERPTRWLGWLGRLTPEERRRNEAGVAGEG